MLEWIILIVILIVIFFISLIPMRLAVSWVTGDDPGWFGTFLIILISTIRNIAILFAVSLLIGFGLTEFININALSG